MSSSRLVWSDDPKDKKCPKCQQFLADCKCPKQEFAGSKFVVIFRMEKNGRGGKTVTVLDALPKNEIFLKELCKEIKTKCGVGGTHLMDGQHGVIEIQGDKRVQIKAMFDKKGIKYKGM